MLEKERLTTEEFSRWWRETGERELRELLYWVWDPIGVNDSFPYTADEYDQYAPQVVKALRARASRDQLINMLKMVERERMGLCGDASGLLSSVANRIVEWYEQSQERWSDFGPLRR